MITSAIRLDIAVISVRGRGRDKGNTRLKLDDFLPNSDILSLFEDFVNSFSDFKVDTELKKSIKFTDKIKYRSSDRIISGIIESGEYGIEEAITDHRGFHKSTKAVDDLGVKPFYYLFWIPKNSNVGILITQRIGNASVSSILKGAFKRFFQDRHDKLLVEFSQFLSKETAQKFIQSGGVREIILKKASLPPDVADRLGISVEMDNIESVEVIITARRNSFLGINDKVIDQIENPNAKFFVIDELESLGFDGSHQSSVKLKLGRTTRTIDLSETGQIQPFFDVDEQIMRHPSGHPVFESIDKVAISVVDDLKEEIFNL